MPEIDPAALETGAAQPSLRETILTTYREAKEAAPDATAEPGQSGDTASGDDEGAKGERTRDPGTGRFVAKDGDGAAADTQAADEGKGAEPAAPDTGKAAEPTQAVPAVDLPQSWPQADKDLFAKASALPKEAQDWARQIQEIVARRDKEANADYTRKTQAVAPLVEIVDGAKDYFASTAGVEPVQAIRNLLQAEFSLRYGNQQQKEAVWQDIINSYGPPPANLLPNAGQTQAAPSEQEGDWVNPAIAAHPVVTALTKEVEALKSSDAQRRQAWEAEQRTRLNAEIAAFENEKDASGKPAHPHFKAVVADMKRIEKIERASGNSPTLSDLYEAAIWNNPTVRAQLLAEHQAEQQRKAQEDADAKRKAQEAEAKAKAEAARKASASVNGAPRGGSQSPVSGGSLRETIMRAKAESAGRI